MSLIISAVICTFNRANYLRKAIQSLVEQTLPIERYEILVIDNRSTDETRTIVLEEFASVPNLRYLYEPIQGLSQARNTGWQNAQGEYVAYLDDDAIASPHWLEAILDSFNKVQPQPGMVGGKIDPIWEAPRPSWLDDSLLIHLTIIDWSEVPIILDDWRRVAGANMAFPKSILELFQGFEIGLGRQGTKLLSNEENFLTDKLKKRGYSVYYDPKIHVQHHVSETRLTQKWFLQRNYWQGISNAVTLIKEKSLSDREQRKIGIQAIKLLLKKPKKRLLFMLFSWLFSQPLENQVDFRDQCFILEKIGYSITLLGMGY